MTPDQASTQQRTDLLALHQTTLTLTSLAILKVDIDEHYRNYTDYLATFALSALGTHKPEVVTDALVADLLEKDFGLKVPVKAVQHVLRRMDRAGHLRKENQAFFLAANFPAIDFSAKRADAAIRIQGVYDALCQYAATVQIGLVWTNTEAANAIIGFLAHFTVDCLKTYVFNTALPHIPETGPKELYVVSRFLQHVLKHDRSLFEDFVVLVKGQMYANAVTCPDLQSLEQKFDRLTFYLDTPLVVNLLGLQGATVKQAAQELATLCRDLRGSVAVFEHTLQEVKGVIRYAIDRIDDPKATSRILREVRNTGVTLSDLMVCLDQIQERLRDEHVSVKRTPQYAGGSEAAERTLQIDEAAFEAALADDIHYFSQQAVLNDINSVRSIYVLRREVAPARLEDAVAVFVTTNATFSRVAFEFGKDHNSLREVSAVITAYSLANVAWLKAPMKRPTLPEKEMLALCYAALEPSKELFKKYVQTMEQLKATGQISEDDHAILRLSPTAQRELMDLTVGDEEALTGAGVRQILGRVKESLVEEHKKAFAEERLRIDAEHAKIETELVTAARKHEEKEQILNATLADIHRTAEDERARRDKGLLMTSTRARIVSRLLTLVVTILALGVLSLGTAAGSGLLPTQGVGPWISWTCWLAIVFAVVWGVYSWHSGKALRHLIEQLENRVTLKVYSWLTGEEQLPGVAPGTLAVLAPNQPLQGEETGTGPNGRRNGDGSSS